MNPRPALRAVPRLRPRQFAGLSGATPGTRYNRHFRRRYPTAPRAALYRPNEPGRRPVALLSRCNDNLRLLARSIIAGSWNKTALADRLERSLGGGPPDPARLAARLLFHFDDPQPPTRRRLIDFLRGEEQLCQRFAKRDGPGIQGIVLDPPTMAPPPESLLTLPLPQLGTTKALREWLGLLDHELSWFADTEGRQHKVDRPKLHHYRYRWIEKRCGAPRLLEVPKTRLKAIQRRILREILNRVPPHPSAHGFSRGRSCLTFGVLTTPLRDPPPSHLM